MCAASVSVQADEVTGQSNTLSLPRPRLEAHGPGGCGSRPVAGAGFRQPARPEDLDRLAALPPDAAAPFTFSPNDRPGRAALIDFFAGQVATGMSESFGAKLWSIKEVK